MYCACASKYSQLFAVHQLQHSYELSASPSAPPIRRTKMGLLEKMMVAKLRPSVVPWLQRLDRKQQKNKHVIKDKDTTDTQDASDTQSFASVQRHLRRALRRSPSPLAFVLARGPRSFKEHCRPSSVPRRWCRGFGEYWVPSGNDWHSQLLDFV